MQMLMQQVEEEIDPELLCQVGRESHEPREATRYVCEPFTPSSFRVPCCDECAADLISQGYTPANGLTCNECRTRLDAINDERGTCNDCQSEIDGKERQREQQADYAARRSQYSYLVHESVMKANEIVIEPNGDWRVRK